METKVNPIFSQILAEYQRPVRTIIWVICITFAFFWLIITGGTEDMTRGVLELLILGMFADMGVYSVLKTYEKTKQAKIDGNQNVVETITDPSKNTNIENVNVGNEIVNMEPTKEKKDIKFE